MYSLEVLVKEAVNLPNVEIAGKSDPYVIVQFQGTKEKTKVIEDCLDPKWNETLKIDLKGKPLVASDVLLFTVKDKDKVSPDKFMGSVEVPLRGLLTGSEELSSKLVLKNKKGHDTLATLETVIKYISPKPSGDASGGGITVNQTDDGSGGGSGGSGEGGTGVADASGGVTADTTGGVSGNIGTGKAQRKIREPYSTKPQDFQIRVKVVEARQLYGSNIPPVCKVVCAGKSKETKVRSPTNSPFWNETFFFNFHESPAMLLDKPITFGVYHSKKMRKDALIGSFRFDLALAYEQEKHSLINKWLLLCDPDDPMSGAKGYLKVSVVILGPGDDAPSMKVDSGEDDDIEANLLRPAGVQLRPAVFRLRIYMAEDLPRMDSGASDVFSKKDKALVDPYVEVSFAGKKMRTSTKYANDHPEWNEEIVLNLQFPSMCEKLKFTVYDWDRVGDNDPVATGQIFLSHISAFRSDVDGFLPTFGPCFINLYGSPREYGTLPNKYEALNLGKAEGAAYRGRVLVELRTELLNEPVPDEVKPIDADKVAQVQKLLRRRKYRLHAAFISATQIPGEKNKPIEFEVSIGNYGNKLDDSVPPCASTTPPSNPVYDGRAYSYLPWGDEKPCAVIDSQWEDISYRLNAINMFKKIADKLSINMAKIRMAVAAKAEQEHQAQVAIAAIDEFILDCSQSLPVWEPENNPPNEMDTHLKELRERQLKELHDQAVEARENVATIEEAIQLLQDYQAMMKQLSIEPQQSFPDVVIWMLSGGQRKAYYRIPAHMVLYSSNPLYSGMYCGVPQTLNFKQPKLKEESENKYLRAPVQIRTLIWLGLDKDQDTWTGLLQEASPKVVAETYENQACIAKRWLTTRPPLTRPAWSDSTGKIEMKKESFQPPPGWKWDGDWFVNLEKSVLYKEDAGKSSFVEELYYNEARTPTTSWVPTETPYTDPQGDPRDPPEKITLPEGWAWEGEWTVDLKRCCDEEGFEYATNSTEESYMATEKLHHMFRRKRLIRKRVYGEAAHEVKQTVVGSIIDQKVGARLSMLDSMSPAPAEEWEYAFNFDSKFHTKERNVDMVRRRRWHRFLVPKGEGATSYVMQLDEGSTQAEESKKHKKKENLVVPRVYLQYEKSHDWQMRAYIFQARNLLAGDQTGMSDPYVLCSFVGMCQSTEMLQGTICPTWDETLIFDHISMCGAPDRIMNCPPPVTIEVFDWEKVGSDNFLGHCEVFPFIQLDPQAQWTPMLRWNKIKKGSRDGGELLAAFELILLDGRDPPVPPPRRGDLYRVPDKIRPKLKRMGIEILCWGIRNMAKYQLASVNKPSVQFEIGGVVCESEIIKSMKNCPNFSNPRLFVEAMLPEEAIYMPPLNISVRDHRAFGQKPRVGIHVLSSLSVYQVAPRTTDIDPVLQMKDLSENAELLAEIVPKMASAPPRAAEAHPKKKKKKFITSSLLDMEQLDDEVDWWSKLYASLGEWQRCLKYKELGYDTLKVYTDRLEEHFYQFEDFCNTFQLSKGKNLDEDEDNFAGEFKGSFRVYPLPEDPKAPLPKRYFEKLTATSDTEECIVRVYIVRGIELQPNDPSGLADPYIEIKLGNKKYNSRDKYIPNTLNPDFGRMFELKCRLPVEKDLRIQVKDYDVVGSDDVIGETSIDLENRRLTKFRATCGIPQSYYVSGPNQWRDSKVPSAILVDLCDFYGLPAPQTEDATDAHPYPTCRVGEKKFSLDQFERGMVPNPHHGPPKERLALHILNILPIVKEHVETRPIFNSLQPEIEQGKLQMWVDLFPASIGQPGPVVDITPRVPADYVLRVVVWNTVNVVLQETNILGEKMSDIYVKGWISGVDDRQKTDVHYRSLDGEGNFNWRFVFPFLYLPPENMVVIKRKEHFWSLDATETRVRPSLIMQVWDNDLFSPDDFLGTLELNLANMPSPAKSAKHCSLSMVQAVGKDSKLINLFDCRRAKGFWPFMNEEDGKQVLTGKIEMEMEVLTKQEEALRPAGRARDAPNLNPKLDPPKRPETSFLWITSPWKTFKFIIWKRCKWVFIGIIIAILLGLLIALFIYAIPKLLARKMIGVKASSPKPAISPRAKNTQNQSNPSLASRAEAQESGTSNKEKDNTKKNANPEAGKDDSVPSQTGKNAGSKEPPKPPLEPTETLPEDDKRASGGGSGGDSAPNNTHRNIRQTYSSKPQDFQIRVKVVEARQLQGGNVSPVCKVTCWNRREETHVKNSTNSPYWNEIFFFNFHESPADLLDQTITFSVYNSHHLRKDSLIGSFKFDLSVAYEENQHSMLNKWLLLSNPDDPMAGAKGYLKISIVILGPGDEAPSMKPVDADGEEDIEANLLRPAGVQLRPAVFKIRLFLAEDLPRMDPDTFRSLKNLMSRTDTEKEFADPYMILNFAGKSLKSSIKYGTDHPEWNEELSVNLQFPSMCERIKLTFFDWDRATEDDPIGTTTISLTETSAQGGDGFLPTFGPCFVNLYGSPREYSDLPDKYEALNLGKGEGVAYRGRVLLELVTELLEEPTKNEVKPLEPDVVARTQKSLRRRKYRLYTAFLSASMISEEKDSPIEFEVSIGNHGNKLDESVTPCASTTPPTYPVYNGQEYSYLPWGAEKPCTVVDSQWEDIPHRLCAINMLLKIADRLARNIEKVNVAVVAALSPEEQAQLAIASLDEFILDCSRPLPPWDPENCPETELDRNLRRLRENELKSLKKQALLTRETVSSIEEALARLRSYHDVIKNLTTEPQTSIPDVIIWMLSGSKRVAFHRILAHEVLFHSNEEYRGRFCGVTQTINLKKPRLSREDDIGFWKIPAQLRAIFWLGLEKDQYNWKEVHTEAKIQVLAETYENQASIMGTWVTTKPPLTRPAWSDTTGRLELVKESFTLPPGWKWDGDWFINPELSVLYEKDSGHTTFVEDLFYNEFRTPTTSWGPATPTYTDAQGDITEAPDKVQLADGWEWEGDWEIDYNRPCDNEGFEYTVNSTLGGYMAVEKLFHMFRRRRIIRRRVLKTITSSSNKEVPPKTPQDAWEYAFNFEAKFHSKERKVDMVRRRRWHRAMVPIKKDMDDASCVMQLTEGPGKPTKGNLTVPRVYLRHKKAHVWHLRAYLFQARSLLGADDTGLSDPYVRCSFLGLSQRTEKIMATLCPTWDQTLIFDHVEIHGDPTVTAAYPPPIVVEIFDWDQLNSDQFLGRCQIVPLVRLDTETTYSSMLQWHKIEKGTKYGGELLAAFELILLDGKSPPLPPTRRGALYNVPEGIRPVLQRTGIEILCWGVRNVSKHQLASVNSPSVEFEIGGQVIESSIIKDMRRNPNFSDPLLFLDVMLPKEELYTPPMNICVRDHRAFGLRPLVGLHVMKNFATFKVKPRIVRHDPIMDIPGRRTTKYNKSCFRLLVKKRLNNLIS
ncbi:hypothetical protein PHET_02557 [Paragonimus heterotremus]|uniref:C2 domain-containing protein n=1 Tax=Paragonimus heterotremus TaxID=100268 RepID=A0A8J4T207_9TREM|nr:hypothetical protein PHET_02557 [Paragonimus heterotremus]